MGTLATGCVSNCVLSSPQSGLVLRIQPSPRIIVVSKREIKASDSLTRISKFDKWPSAKTRSTSTVESSLNSKTMKLYGITRFFPIHQEELRIATESTDRPNRQSVEVYTPNVSLSRQSSKNQTPHLVPLAQLTQRPAKISRTNDRDQEVSQNNSVFSQTNHL